MGDHVRAPESLECAAGIWTGGTNSPAPPVSLRCLGMNRALPTERATPSERRSNYGRMRSSYGSAQSYIRPRAEFLFRVLRLFVAGGVREPARIGWLVDDSGGGM